MVRSSSLLLSLALLSACVTQGTVKKAPADAGIACSYTGPPEGIRQAALDALREAGFVTTDAATLDPTRWQVLATNESAQGKGRIARVIGESRTSESVIRILVRSKAPTEGSDRSDAELAQSMHEQLARKIGRPAPAPGGAPGKTINVGVEKTYISNLMVCFDVALQVLRDRDYRVADHARPGGDEVGRIVARGHGFSVTLTMSRSAGSKTRVVVLAEGRGEEENRDEALVLLHQLRKSLLEPLD